MQRLDKLTIKAREAFQKAQKLVDMEQRLHPRVLGQEDAQARAIQSALSAHSSSWARPALERLNSPAMQILAGIVLPGDHVFEEVDLATHKVKFVRKPSADCADAEANAVAVGAAASVARSKKSETRSEPEIVITERREVDVSFERF